MNHHVADPQTTERDPLVISLHDHGYRVYAAHNPNEIFFVEGGAGAETCTCADFGHNRPHAGYRCRHILAVLHRIGTHADRETVEERRAIQDEGDAAQAGAAQMLLKRSVSPDGRIDSLSVEFTCPVDGLPAADIEAKARHALSVQTTIVTDFLGNRGGSTTSRARGPRLTARPPQTGGDRPVPATLVNVGGMDTRWGRRLFINIRVDDKVLKLFGSPHQLGRALSDAGHNQYAEYVSEGMQIDLPCKVTTKPSDNGQYTNIDRVFPADRNEGGWNNRR